jgi:hypothetical protein
MGREAWAAVMSVCLRDLDEILIAGFREGIGGRDLHAEFMRVNSR